MIFRTGRNNKQASLAYRKLFGQGENVPFCLTGEVFYYYGFINHQIVFSEASHDQNLQPQATSHLILPVSFK